MNNVSFDNFSKLASHDTYMNGYSFPELPKILITIKFSIVLHFKFIPTLPAKIISPGKVR
jgi:hypothetical protein